MCGGGMGCFIFEPQLSTMTIDGNISFREQNFTLDDHYLTLIMTYWAYT